MVVVETREAPQAGWKVRSDRTEISPSSGGPPFLHIVFEWQVHWILEEPSIVREQYILNFLFRPYDKEKCFAKLADVEPASLQIARTVEFIVY